MSHNWQGGSTRAWRKLRAQVLARDGYRCRLNLDGCLGAAELQVHHTLGRSVSGDDPAYLITACGPCNRAAGDPTASPDPVHVPTARW